MTLTFGSGWVPGIIGWCAAEHGRYYAANWGFSAFFEAKVAAGLAEFVERLDRRGNLLAWASDDSQLIGFVALDHDNAEEGLDRLRWFFVADRGRGKGIGRTLISSCIETSKANGADGIFLTTFAGLDAARKLYEDVGFVLVHEKPDDTWGVTTLEQRFELRF